MWLINKITGDRYRLSFEEYDYVVQKLNQILDPNFIRDYLEVEDDEVELDRAMLDGVVSEIVSKMPMGSYLETLPDEMIDEICKYMSYGDLTNFIISYTGAQVCQHHLKKFYTINTEHTMGFARDKLFYLHDGQLCLADRLHTINPESKCLNFNMKFTGLNIVHNVYLIGEDKDLYKYDITSEKLFKMGFFNNAENFIDSGYTVMIRKTDNKIVSINSQMKIKSVNFRIIKSMMSSGNIYSLYNNGELITPRGTYRNIKDFHITFDGQIFTLSKDGILRIDFLYTEMSDILTIRGFDKNVVVLTKNNELILIDSRLKPLRTWNPSFLVKNIRVSGYFLAIEDFEGHIYYSLLIGGEIRKIQ